MRFLRIAVCILILSPAAGARQSAAGESSGGRTTEFRQLAEQWRQAYNSKDAQNLAPLYAENARYISAHVDGYIADGKNAVIANFQKGMDGGGYLDSLQVLEVDSSCDLTFVITRYTGRAGGRNADGRNLLVWRKIREKWLIVAHMTAVRD